LDLEEKGDEMKKLRGGRRDERGWWRREEKEFLRFRISSNYHYKGEEELIY